METLRLLKIVLSVLLWGLAATAVIAVLTAAFVVYLLRSAGG